MEPHKKFNTQWGTVYSRILAELTKEEIIAKCPKDVMDIHVPRRDDGDRLVGSSIIKLDFEKDPLDPYIIMGRENIQLIVKKDSNFRKSNSKLGIPKTCAEATTNFAKTA